MLCRLNNIRYILITGLIFLAVEFSHSQSPERKIVLATYIQQIESSSELIFNYADDIILDNLIIPSSESLDSKGYANYLTSQSGLVFQALDAYTIQHQKFIHALHTHSRQIHTHTYMYKHTETHSILLYIHSLCSPAGGPDGCPFTENMQLSTVVALRSHVGSVVFKGCRDINVIVTAISCGLSSS